jgi:hypothetical protein
MFCSGARIDRNVLVKSAILQFAENLILGGAALSALR